MYPVAIVNSFISSASFFCEIFGVSSLIFYIFAAQLAPQFFSSGICTLYNCFYLLVLEIFFSFWCTGVKMD